MIAIDVVHSGTLASCSCSGQALTKQNPLLLVRQHETALQFRFCTASGTADSAITAAMLALPQVTLTAGDRQLALTDSDFTVSTGSDGVLAAAFSAVLTDSTAVREYLADHLEEALAEGVPALLEFSSRRSSSDTSLAVWFAIPVRLFNPAKSDASDSAPVSGATYLTAAETRAAIAEALEDCTSTTLTSATVTPHHNRIYAKTLTASDAFAFTAPESAAERLTFELHLTQPATAVTFSWSSTIWWMDAGGNFASTNDAPDFSTANCAYALVFRWDGTRWLGNLAYTQTVTA